MKALRLGVLVCIVCVALVPPAPAQSTLTSPGKEARAHGIWAYESLDVPMAQRAVILKDRRGRELGNFVITRDPVGIPMYELTTADGRRLSIAFDKERGVLRVKDWSTEETGTAQFDFQSRQWTRDVILQRLLISRQPDIELVGMIVSDLEPLGQGPKNRALAGNGTGGCRTSSDPPNVGTEAIDARRVTLLFGGNRVLFDANDEEAAFLSDFWTL